MAEKRPPRQVWCLVNGTGKACGAYHTKAAAKHAMTFALGQLRIVGPYVLAERVRER